MRGALFGGALASLVVAGLVLASVIAPWMNAINDATVQNAKRYTARVAPKAVAVIVVCSMILGYLRETGAPR